MVHKKCGKTTTCPRGAVGEYCTVMRLSAGLNPFTHVEHAAQDVEWNIDCAKPVVAWR